MPDELKKELVGVFFGVRVFAAWWPVPQDQQYPWRWGMVLEGPTLDDFAPFPHTRIRASYNDARTEEEARAKALEQARALVESLPGRWRDEDEVDL